MRGPTGTPLQPRIVRAPLGRGFPRMGFPPYRAQGPWVVGRIKVAAPAQNMHGLSPVSDSSRPLKAAARAATASALDRPLSSHTPALRRMRNYRCHWVPGHPHTSA